MSERIVILGPNDGKKIQAAEIPPMDGGAFLNSGHWRVSLTLYDGPLANATVIGPNPIDRMISAGDWKNVLRLCPQAIPFEIDVPMDVAEYGDDWKDGSVSTETIGTRLRRLRIEGGFSQRDLAVGAPLNSHHKRGITAAYISLIEKGDRYPSLDVIRYLAHKLGVTVDHLEAGRDDPALTFTVTLAEIDEAVIRWMGGEDSQPSWAELSQADRDRITFGIHGQILDTLAANIYALDLINRREPA